MTRARVGGTIAVSAALLLAWAYGGRAQQGTTGKVGAKLDEAAKAIKRGVNEVKADVREGFERTREAAHAMGVQARVYTRLHWDKALNTATLHVEVKSGVATLSGSVPDDAAKAKAVLLARDTVGVTDVVDQLSVGGPTGSTTTGAGGTTIEKKATGAVPKR
jgi:osmotically-inducible protein OsmY